MTKVIVMAKVRGRPHALPTNIYAKTREELRQKLKNLLMKGVVIDHEDGSMTAFRWVDEVDVPEIPEQLK